MSRSVGAAVPGSLLLRAILVLAVAFVPRSALAQGSGAGSGEQLRAGAFGAIGFRPSGASAVGVQLVRPVHSWMAIGVEVSRWASGTFGECHAMLPSSCEARGLAALGGATAAFGGLGRVAPYVELQAGGFLRSGIPIEQSWCGAVAVGAGGEWPLSRDWEATGGVRFLRVFDDGYEDLVGERLRYGVVQVGIRYYVRRFAPFAIPASAQEVSRGGATAAVSPGSGTGWNYQESWSEARPAEPLLAAGLAGAVGGSATGWILGSMFTPSDGGCQGWDCNGWTPVLVALLGSTVGAPVAAHLANRRRGDPYLSSAAAAVVGLAGGAGAAISGRDRIVIGVLLGVPPVQAVVSSLIEHGSSRHR
jgi:hypothetical protein